MSCEAEDTSEGRGRIWRQKTHWKAEDASEARRRVRSRSRVRDRKAWHKGVPLTVDAYEQVRVQPEDVHKMAFATITGTYVSNIVQQGDCNAPATFQRLMMVVFCDVISRFIHVYLDDIFIYSNSIEEHEWYLKLVFN